MKERTPRATVILAVLCCCVLVLAATAHLLHSTHGHHRHAKNVADNTCTICTFAANSASLPFLATLEYRSIVVSWVERETFAWAAAVPFAIPSERAPPPRTVSPLS
jgi:hypothetical protein